MSLRIYDSQLEHRIALKMAAAEAANACTQAIANNAEVIKWANFYACQQLTEASRYLALARIIYEGIATETPEPVELHPGLEARLQKNLEPDADTDPSHELRR